MKKIIHIILVLGLAGNMLFAQNKNDANDVKRKINSLERKIEQIRVLAVRYDNQQALAILSDAQSDLDQAVDLYKEWEDDKRKVGKLVEARTKYQSADKKADYATRLILFKPAANLQSSLDNLIRQAEAASAKDDSNELYYFLNKARAFQKKAMEAFANDHYLQGHEYLKISTYFAEKTIELTKSKQNGSTQGANFEEQKNNIQQLLNRASNNTGDPLIDDLVGSTREYLDKAVNAYNRGNLKNAFSHLQIAERLLYRIIDLADTDDIAGGGQLEQNFQSLGRYLNSIRNEMDSNNQQSKLLDKAEQFYREAEKNINNQQYDQAETNLALAQRMAIKAFRSLSSGQGTDVNPRLGSRLDDANHLINLQQNRLDESQDKSLTFLHEQAKNFLRDAERAYENNDPQKTSFLLNVCLRLLNRIETQLKSSPDANLSAKIVEDDLNRIGNIFIRLQENTSLDDKNRFKVNILEEMFRKAQNEFEKNNLFVVNEILFIVQHQLGNLRNN